MVFDDQLRKFDLSSDLPAGSVPVAEQIQAICIPIVFLFFFATNKVMLLMAGLLVSARPPSPGMQSGLPSRSVCPLDVSPAWVRLMPVRSVLSGSGLT